MTTRPRCSPTITTTTPDATLSVVDASTTAAGHLVNGTLALQQPLKIRANNAANTGTAYTALPETGASTPLLTYSAPTTADRVTLGLPAVHRRVRDAAAWHVRQDADVHAVQHHAVSSQ